MKNNFREKIQNKDQKKLVVKAHQETKGRKTQTQAMTQLVVCLSQLTESHIKNANCRRSLIDPAEKTSWNLKQIRRNKTASTNYKYLKLLLIVYPQDVISDYNKFLKKCPYCNINLFTSAMDTNTITKSQHLQQVMETHHTLQKKPVIGETVLENIDLRSFL